MKKMFVLSLAVVALSTQAFAGAKDEKGKEEILKRQEMMKSFSAFRSAAKADPKIIESARDVKKSGLADQLKPDQQMALSQSFAKDASIRGKVEKINSLVKAGKLSKDSGAVIVTGLSNVAKLEAKFRDPKAAFGTPEDKAKQAYASLMLGAAEMALNNPGKTADNFIEVARIANEGATAGKFNDGMQDALKKLREITKNDKLTMDDLNRLCPPVA